MRKWNSIINRPEPQIVCLCGSSRFMHKFREAEMLSALKGCMVLTVSLDVRPDYFREDVSQYLHFDKIQLADRVVVMNLGGCIEANIAREIAYCMALQKTRDDFTPILEFYEPVNGIAYMKDAENSVALIQMCEAFSEGYIPKAQSPNPVVIGVKE